MSYSWFIKALVASQIAKNGVANTSITVDGGVVSKANVVPLSDAAHNLSVTNLINGYYTTSTWASSRNLTLPTAEDLVAAIPNCAAGSSFTFTINNSSSQDAVLTASAGTSILSGGTISTANIKTFIVVITPAYPDPTDTTEPITMIPAAAVVYPL